MKTIEIKIFNFSELSEKAKFRAYKSTLQNVDTWWLSFEFESAWEKFMDIFNIQEFRNCYNPYGNGEAYTWNFQKVRRYFIENWPQTGNFRSTKRRKTAGDFDYPLNLAFVALNRQLKKKENIAFTDVIEAVENDFNKELEWAIEEYTSFETYCEHMEWDDETYFLENGDLYLDC